MEDYHFKFDVHWFEEKGEKRIFNQINNREINFEKSRVNNLLHILKSKYDDIQYSVSTGIYHKLIYEEIQKMSTKKNKKIIQIKKIMKNLKKNDEIENKEEITNKQKIKKFLIDLNNLGMIIYFNEKELNKFLIFSPKFINEIIKSIFNMGKKEIEIMIYNLYIILEMDFEEIIISNNNTKIPKNHNINHPTHKKNFLTKESKKICKEEIQKILNLLKGRSNLNIPDIWLNKEEIKKSNVDKIGYQSLLKKFLSLHKILMDQG